VTFQKLAWLNEVIGSNFIWPCHITANEWDYPYPLAFNSKGTLLYCHNVYLEIWAKQLRQLPINILSQFLVQMGVHQTQQLGQCDFTLLQNIAPLLF
jgi:hypothetical protein